MSKSRHKRRLIVEAVSAFNLAMVKDKLDWSFELADIMNQCGWKVSHPGQDKYIAIKGPLVCKWIGRARYRSGEAIRDTVVMHRIFSSAGLDKFLPRLYVKIGKLFIIEQRCETDMYDKHFYYSQLHSITRSKRVIVEDMHSENIGKIRNVPKVIDGHIYI